MERFHRSLDRELLSQHTWRDLAHCAKKFPRFRELYNCERSHDSLSIGVQGRGRFYEEVGAIRDVVQNHMLQVMALLAMDPPGGRGEPRAGDDLVELRWFEPDELPGPAELAFTHYPEVLSAALGRRDEHA